MDAYALGEIERRLGNIVRIGTIKELDEDKALVKVDLGDLVTDWLPWGEARAGAGQRTWAMPEVNEQVMLLSPSGEVSQGVVGPSIFQDNHGAPANKKTTSRQQFADGAFLQYDRVGHAWTLDVPSGGSITLHIGSTTLLLENGKATLTTPLVQVTAAQTNFSGNVAVAGNLTVAGTTAVQGITSVGKNVGNTHTHSGIQSGPGNTGAPN